METPARRWQFWIDVGGTFTDCVAQSPEGEQRVWKVLSSGRVPGQIDAIREQVIVDSLRHGDPHDFWQGWTLHLFDEHGSSLGFSEIANSTPDGELHLHAALPAATAGQSYVLQCTSEAPLICIRYILGLRQHEFIPPVDIRLGTTRGTNALLERKGARTAFLVTRGFRDILQIGNQDRPDLFALNIAKPVPLATDFVEIEERLSADGSILRSLDVSQARRELQRLKAEGVQSIAICLVHAYRNSHHEEVLEALAREIGFEEVSRSSRLAPAIKLVPRSETTVLNAYLTPVLRSYVDHIGDALGLESSFKLMTSQGGLVASSEFSGKDCILSGPAGGVAGMAAVMRQAGFQRVIGFDMGGTSTDVSRFDGRFDLEYEATKAGVRMAVPLLAIETVAAGGGSLCTFDGVQLKVGPESAGADPGPTCYGRGGPLTITDMNVFLGRVLVERFPFPLDLAAIACQLEDLCERIAHAPGGKTYSPHQLAQGFIDIANETMTRAVRSISIRKGYDPAKHALLSFGGAGGQHACAIARILRMESLLVHPLGGVLSAYGMGLADTRLREERNLLVPYDEGLQARLAGIYSEMEQRLQERMQADGIPANQTETALRGLRLRYQGTEAAILIPEPDDGDYHAAFEAEHLRLHGYVHKSRNLEAVAAIVEVLGRLPHLPPLRLPRATSELQPQSTAECWVDHRAQQVPVFDRTQFQAGHHFSGPALVSEAGSTILVERGFDGRIDDFGVLHLQRTHQSESPQASVSLNAVDEELDPVRLEVFNNRFASVAEQMGVTLRMTSISTNVKERLDYSCALFDAEGGLVVNAPHIPVHLGAMSETVRCLLRDCPTFAPGDVYLTNDPYAGGSHLPDLTVVTPIHDESTGEFLFFTASRAHHAEIGGIRPGSMPPFSRTLGEEGVLIQHFKVVDGGEFQREALRSILTSGPYPSRRPNDNLADIEAQIAANRRGEELLRQLVEEAGLTIVKRAMQAIQRLAESKMRLALSRLKDGHYPYEDHLDDGSPIRVLIIKVGDQARIDFTGTGPQLATNLNANPAIVSAAVLYVMRCFINEPMPLNSGVLRPIEIIVPTCLLNPEPTEDRASCPAVVGGNVETSQRVVDVLLGALNLAAASQGTMNNLTFGDSTFGYYETICGGAGATPDAPGADAVQTHMTNTRLTDVEILEHRYPVRVEEFSIRKDSGGQGRHRGGHGIRRVFEFLKPLSLSLLTQRRGPYAPFGLHGGEPGALGRNLWRKPGDETPRELPGAAQLDVSVGDQLMIETPGGGGFGERR